jgi:hypothetical protein
MFILGIENPVMRRMRDRTGKNVKSMGTPRGNEGIIVSPGLHEAHPGYIVSHDSHCGSVSVNSSHIGKKDRIGAKRFGVWLLVAAFFAASLGGTAPQCNFNFSVVPGCASRDPGLTIMRLLPQAEHFLGY